MASASPTFSLSSSTLIDGKASLQQPHCISLRKSVSLCRKSARNVITMATGETQVVTTSEPVTTSEASVTTSEAPAEATIDVSDILQKVQSAWDKVDDKYALTSLAVVGIIVIWGSTGLISAIDRLPLIPGLFELVGIGYTGWFLYQNLIFKPDREALVKKVKDTYSEIIGSS